MSISDWIAGLALAGFLSLPFGMVVGLFVKVSEPSRKYDRNEPIVGSRDIRRTILAAFVFLVLFTPMMALLAKKDRQDAESWQTYTRDHKCVVVDQRTRTESHFNAGTKTIQFTFITEYLWRCEGGDEHWHP